MSREFITHTTEELLEPWIQWVTVHTGVPLSEHGIIDLDEADKLRHSAFWETLDPVLLLSPMNVKFAQGGESVFLPDPWAASQAPSSTLQPLYKFIRAAVNGHARADKFEARDVLSAMRFLVSHGLSLDSCAAIAKQLTNERVSPNDVKWRRATILDRLLWDVFEHFWTGPVAPRVGVFFSNATAHYQHKYWSHHDPAGFAVKPGESELEAYGDAILFGYQAQDRLIGKALALAGKDTAIAMCTALSQQPMHDYEDRGGKAMFIAKDYRKLLPLLGAAAASDEPLMAEESRLHFDTHALAERAFASVNAARTAAGAKVFKTRGLDGRSFIVGCALFASEVRDDTLVVLDKGAPVPFLDFFVKMKTTTTAKHHPDGLLWVTNPAEQVRHSGVEHLPLTMVRTKLEQAMSSTLS
ncbi:MAG: hypothetical protein EOO73_13800 [Myxococcales bacterium]|nr:MAG: hypothetical protein EOO73_13800 [Myxococcales bacterium]